MAIEIVKYQKEHKKLWDDFMRRSKNGTFLFYRDYMDYHSDRFHDHSLLFFDNNKLLAILPANSKDSILCSHGGLTFGGVVSDRKMRTPLMIEVFAELKKYLKKEEIVNVLYKTIPYIYHDVPAEEDLYALFVNNAKLIRRDVSSAIFMKERDGFSQGRKWSVKKSKQAGMEVKKSNEIDDFIAIEEAHLNSKYGIKPVHSSKEMGLLMQRFPENIKLFAAYKNTCMLGGVIVYESNNVAHTQYIAATDEGKDLGATDFVLDFLINEYYANKKYFDFGISTENEGRYLNKGLIANKEGFGARAVVYDTYELKVE